MATATQHRKTHHPHKRTHGYAKTHGHSKMMKPIKRMNQKMMRYVAKKPAKSIGIATLISAIVIGAIFAKRYFNN